MAFETFTPTDAAACGEALAELSTQLAAEYPLPRTLSARLGWSTVEWATFVQGLLRGLGYDAEIVLHDDPGGLWLSLLVRVPSEDSFFGYVPVGLRLPSEEAGIGYIAWSEAGVSFDSRYATFTSVLETPENTPPTFAILSPRQVVVREPAEFAISGYDPEGELVAIAWSLDGVLLGTEARRTMTVRFPEDGRHILTATAFDKGGASSTQSIEVRVSSISDNDCGC